MPCTGGGNAHIYRNNGAGLDVVEATGFDIAISFIVFQHIPEASVIERYVRDVASRLKPDGIFKAQVQGDPLALLGRGNTWEGCYVPASTWLRWACQYGLRLLDFEGCGTQYLWLWFERSTQTSSGLLEKDLSFLAAESDAFEHALGSLAGKLLDKTTQLETALEQIHRSWGYRLVRRLGLAPS